MKKTIFILAFLGIFKISSGQDTTKRFEFGSTIATVNMDDLGYSPPTFKFVNGLFFRYSKKRIALRLNVSYSDNTFSHTSVSNEFPYFWGRTSNNKDFRLGIGGQFSFLKRKKWVYTFLDLSYRNLFSTGYSFGNWQYEFSSTSNGIDCFGGIGFKLKLLDFFYISPEIGYYSSSQFVKRTTTSADTYNVVTGQRVSYKDSYAFTEIYPVLKLHLTVNF